MITSLKWLTVGLLTATPLAADAQEDFRSADPDRPIRIEDANPIKFREWEFEVGSRGTLAEGPADGLHGMLELKAGLFRNSQVGIALETAVRQSTLGTGTDAGLEAAEIHFLLGVMRETTSLPALAVKFGASAPGIGSVRNEDAQAGITGILTRSLGRVRVHGNTGYTVASRVDGGDFWMLGLGSDYPIGLFSRAVLADIYAEIPVMGGARVWFDAGTRFQISNWSVLDLGLATRLDQWNDGVANVEVVIGVSRVFGIGGRAPDYVRPTIR